MKPSCLQLIHALGILSVLGPGFIQVMAQAPDSVAGKTIELTISSGDGPFASRGAYRFLPSALDNHYVVVPLSGDVEESYGTYSYSKTSSTRARLSFVDSAVGTLQAECTFTSSTSGSYVLTTAAAPGASQRGTFRIFSGSAPSSIAGGRIEITVKVGAWPFSRGGQGVLLPDATGRYTLDGSGGMLDSQGTYTYTKQSGSTALLRLNDSIVGRVDTLQISFDTATTGTYFVIGSGGGYQAGIFTFTPAVPPTIQTQPRSVTVTAGGTATFSVTATGTAPLAYQWKRNGVNIAGATSATLTLVNVTEAQAGTYTVVVSNAAGSVTSVAVNLTVLPAETLPRLAVARIEAGKQVEINFPTALGKKYVVLRSVDLSSWAELAEFQGTGAPLTLKETVAVPGRGFYRLRVEEAAAAPQIVVPPSSLSVPKGGTVNLTVQATGAQPLQYQWRKDGVDLVGKTAATLTLNSIQPAHAGYYTVVVSNAFGSVESQPALVEVETGD